MILPRNLDGQLNRLDVKIVDVFRLNFLNAAAGAKESSATAGSDVHRNLHQWITVWGSDVVASNKV